MTPVHHDKQKLVLLREGPSGSTATGKENLEVFYTRTAREQDSACYVRSSDAPNARFTILHSMAMQSTWGR